jgi:hypothetical protein
VILWAHERTADSALGKLKYRSENGQKKKKPAPAEKRGAGRVRQAAED